MNDLEYIKTFSKITIKNVCKKANINDSNLYAGRVSKKKVNKVRKMLESEIAKLYLYEEKENETDNTL